MTSVAVVPPSDANVFVLQPVAPTYLECARAAATALVWRFMGVNVGYGYWDARSTGGVGVGAGGKAVRLDDALREQGTPVHVLQVTLAQWLLVWAALPAGSVSLHAIDTAVVPDAINSIAALHERLGRHRRHDNVLVAPLPLLGFLADWIGTVLPTYASLRGVVNAFDGVTQPHMGAVDAVKVRGDGPSRYVAAGAAMPAADFVAAVNAIFGVNAGINRVRVLLVEADRTAGVQEVCLASVTGDGDIVTVPAEPDTTRFTARDTVPLPRAVVVAPEDVDDLTEGFAVGVVRLTPSGGYAALLSSAQRRPPLLMCVLQAAAETMTACLRGRVTLTDLRGAAAGLFYANAEDAEAAVTAAVQAASTLRSTVAIPSVVAVQTLLLGDGAGRTVTLPARRSALHLYVAPDSFDAAAARVGPLADFLVLFDVVHEAAKGRYTLLHTTTRRPQLYLVPSAADAGELAVQAVPLAQAEKLDVGYGESLLAPLLWSLQLTREDVLAAALVPRATLESLEAVWRARVQALRFSRFDEGVATQVVQHLFDGTLFVSGAANRLHPGVVFEIALPLPVLGHCQKLLTAFEAALPYKVLAVKDDPRALMVDRALLDDGAGTATAVLATKQLDLVTGEVTPLPSAVVVEMDSLLAWTETPFVRGFVLDAVACRIAMACGAEAVQTALAELRRAARDAPVNDKDVCAAGRRDAAQLKGAR